MIDRSSSPFRNSRLWTHAIALVAVAVLVAVPAAFRAAGSSSSTGTPLLRLNRGFEAPAKSIAVPAPTASVCAIQVDDESRPPAQYATRHSNDPFPDSLFREAPDPVRGPPSDPFSLV